MANSTNLMIQNDPVIKAASELLSQRIGAPVQCTTVVCISEEERRNRLLRVGIDNPPSGLPASLIIKQVVTEEYDPDQIENWDTLRFFRDWAGAEFLTSLPDEPAHGPRFYGGDRQLGFIILEDLGQMEHSLVEPLLEGDSTSAEAALIGYIQRLGKMHADTLGRADEYQALWRAANPAFATASVRQGLEHQGLPYLNELLPQLGLSIESELLTEIEAMYERVNQPGDFSAFVHADLCPDNMFFAESEVRLIDFEFARFGHALLDAIYPRMLFPTCWCCNRIPQALVLKMEAVYRAELSRTCSAARDDILYYRGLADVCGYSLLETLHWQMPSALDEDRQWGLSTMRPRVLARLTAFVDAASEFDQLPHFCTAANQLLVILETRWPETEPLPLYPAFRS